MQWMQLRLLLLMMLLLRRSKTEEQKEPRLDRGCQAEGKNYQLPTVVMVCRTNKIVLKNRSLLISPAPPHPTYPSSKPCSRASYVGTC
jgi:hypothetical protein